MATRASARVALSRMREVCAVPSGGVARADAGEASGAGREERKLRVLLAEDEPTTRQLVGKLLVACDYEVVAVANGKDALTQLKGENKFDLVLSDIFMPEVSGVELLESLQKQSELANNAAEKEAGVAPSSSHDDRPQQTTDWQQVPVIVMSSQDKQDTVMKCFKLGAADFLVKPVRRNELKNLWQHVWRQAQQQNNNGIAAPQSDAELGEPRTPSPTSTDSTAELLMSMSGEKRKKDALAGAGAGAAPAPNSDPASEEDGAGAAHSTLPLALRQIIEGGAGALPNKLETLSSSRSQSAFSVFRAFIPHKVGWVPAGDAAGERMPNSVAMSAFSPATAAPAFTAAAFAPPVPAAASASPQPPPLPPLDLQDAPPIARQFYEALRRAATGAAAPSEAGILFSRMGENGTTALAVMPQWTEERETRRKAAVKKYLNKRKYRTYDKKVRYESRKRLAETRPRIRGQFVKACDLAEYYANKAKEEAAAKGEAAAEGAAMAEGAGQAMEETAPAPEMAGPEAAPHPAVEDNPSPPEKGESGI